MQVVIDLPDDVAAQLRWKWSDIPRRTLEALVVEGYRREELTSYQVRRLLGFETPMEVDVFLKQNGVYLEYSEDNLAQDTEVSRRASSQHRRDSE